MKLTEVETEKPRYVIAELNLAKYGFLISKSIDCFLSLIINASPYNNGIPNRSSTTIIMTAVQ